MTSTHTMWTRRAVVGAVLIALTAACSDAPSEPRPTATVSRTERTAKIPADRGIPENLTLLSQTTNGEGVEERATFHVTTNRGIASISPSFLGRDASEATPVALRMWDAGTQGVPRVRLSRMKVRLPDNRIAIVDRESSADGSPTTMRVRVDDREFIWRRSWAQRNGMRALASVEVESRVGGRLMARSRVTVTARQVASLRARQAARARSHLLAMSRRFGSVAGTVLLPKLLQAQTDGLACNGAATALAAAWTGWRLTTVMWAISVAIGGLTKATIAEFTASAAVDVAEANYIDCYVAAASAGVPDSQIAPPPVADEL